MVDGLDTSHDSTATPSTAVLLAATDAPVRTEIQAQSPADLPAAIAAMIESQEAKSTSIEPAKADAPKIESPTIQPTMEPVKPEIWITGPSADAVEIGTHVAPAIETKPEPKMPPVVHLTEVATPEASPPTFLRDHATRTIAATPPLRADMRPGNRVPPGVKAPVKLPAKAAPPVREAPRQTKFMLLAASVAVCACAGAALGSAGIASMTRTPVAVAAAQGPDTTAEVKALRDAIAQLGTDVAAARSTLEHINKTGGTQFGRIVERFDRADKAQGEPAAKLAKISDTLERLEKRVAALPVTPPAPVITPAPTPIQSDVVGSITPRPVVEPKAPPKPQILENFNLRRVYDGIAIIEGRNGVTEVVPGEPLPGGGRVEEIKRQDGHWVVVTTKGLIVSQRDR